MTPADLATRPAESRENELAPVAADAFAVDCRGLSKRYGRRWVLADVGFKLLAGRALLVGGHNGSGKSTLFRILATAIRPDRGQASIDGVKLEETTRVRESVALLSHHSYLYESLTAVENLRVVASVTHGEQHRDFLVAQLDHVGLARHADAVVSTFSAGMRKRLALARLLLQKPRVALLDEPYGALDSSGFKLMDDTIGELRGRGATVLLATHLLDRGSELADFGLLLVDGRVAWSGRAGDFPVQAVEDFSQ